MNYEENEEVFDEGYEGGNEMSEVEELKNSIAEQKARLAELTEDEESDVEGGGSSYRHVHVYRSGKAYSYFYWAGVSGRTQSIYGCSNVRTYSKSSGGYTVYRSAARRYMKFTIRSVSGKTTYYTHFTVYCY